MFTQQSDTISEVFSQLYQDYKDRLYTFLLGALNYNTDDASQVLSDVFVQTRDYLQDHELTQPKAFLYRTAHNLAINMIKRSSNRPMASRDELILSYDDVIDQAERRHLQEQVQQSLLSMTPMMREVVQLAYYEDYSYQDIADLLSLPKNTV